MSTAARFVVENPVFRATDGQRIGTARVWVATEERAIEIAAEHHSRTWRPVTPEEAQARFGASEAKEGQ